MECHTVSPQSSAPDGAELCRWLAGAVDQVLADAHATVVAAGAGAWPSSRLAALAETVHRRLDLTTAEWAALAAALALHAVGPAGRGVSPLNRRGDAP